MPTTKTRSRWTNKELQAEVDKLDDEIELYWDYRDELCKESIKKILDDGEEGLCEVEDRLHHLNWEYFDTERDRLIEEQLDAMEKVRYVPPESRRRFETMVEDSDKLLGNVDLKELARCTGKARFTVTVEEPYLSFQAYRGVESKSQVDEICGICTILNINPKALQVFVTCDNENRPSYDPEPAIFPDHPERDGQGYVADDAMVKLLQETSYGGQLVFMFEMDIVDLINSVREGHVFGDGETPIQINKGTLGLIYCFMNGAGSCEDAELVKDLILPAGSYTFRLDSATRYGLQSCYGFSPEPWRQGSVMAVPEEHTNTEPQPNTH